jgi:hypothetical protein
MRHITEPARQIPVIEDVDVLVAGGGPAGVVAAVAAARHGARTMLVERYGFLGGMATCASIGPIASVRTRFGEERVVGGIAWEMIDRMRQHGGALLADGYGDVPIDPEVMKWVADTMATESGVILRYHSFAAQVVKNDGRIDAVIVESKSGRQAIAARTVVDATGDADLVALAGAPFELGRAGDGAMQPMSLAFRLSGVDTAKLGDIGRPYIDPEIRSLAERFVAGGKLPVFGGPWTFWGSTFRQGEVFVNMVRLWGNGADVEVLTRNEVTGRDHIQQFVRFLRENFPQFKDSILMDSGPQIGLRETRRIVGEYRLEVDDVRERRVFPDSIGLAEHSIDIHSPGGTHGQVLERIKPYQIPYRCLLPRGVCNLLVAGRPVSASHEVHASLRVMGSCMVTGEAAGVAASLASQSAGDPRQVDVGELRRRLAAEGALIDSGIDLS